MTGIVNWIREYNPNPKGQAIRIRKQDTNAELIGNILESQLRVNIIGSPKDFAQNNAQKVIEIDQVSTDTEGLFDWAKSYFEESTSYILESYDEKEFLDGVIWQIDYGNSYLPVWVAKWNFDSNEYNVVLDNELDCRFGWVVEGSPTFSTLDQLRNTYED